MRIGFALAVFLCSPLALAQGKPLPPPPAQPPPLPTQPPPQEPNNFPASSGPVVVAPPTAPAAPVVTPPPAPANAGPSSGPPAEGTARVLFRTDKHDETGQLFAAKSKNGEDYTLVCTTPCKADIYPGTPLRGVINNGNPSDFTMRGKPGSTVDLEVSPPKNKGLVGGIIMASCGALVGIGGISLLGEANKTNSTKEPAAGWILTGAGVALIAGGLALILTRSRGATIQEYDRGKRIESMASGRFVF